MATPPESEAFITICVPTHNSQPQANLKHDMTKIFPKLKLMKIFVEMATKKGSKI